MPDDTTRSQLARIETDAPRIAREGAELNVAQNAELDAEAAVLARAIELIKPALAALAHGIRASERTFWPDSAAPATRYTVYEQGGIQLAGNGAEEDYRRANRGDYEGRALYLLVDGTLAEATYTGSWSRWQGESSEWEAEMMPVTPREAMDSWSLGDALEGICTALGKVATRPDATKESKERTERLTAALVSLGGA